MNGMPIDLCPRSIQDQVEMARQVPHPPPTTPDVRVRMQQMPRRDTKPELELRRELYKRGLRYRTCFRPLEGLQCQADVVFTRARIACFVDSCYWHGCEQHLKLPNSNTAWWQLKLETTKARDRRNNRLLEEAGWTVIRVWEHESSHEAADRIEQAVRRTL
jgi:DNA mismatch endonuclease (patch repair protein)